MALTLSLALQNALLDTGSLKSLTDSFLIDIYSGTRPADPSIGATGTKLVTISLNGSGAALSWAAAAAAGKLSKNGAQTWQGTVANTGVAGYFRLYKHTGDVPTNTDAAKYRIDGTIATSGGDMNLTNTTITSGIPQTLTQFDLTVVG